MMSDKGPREWAIGAIGCVLEHYSQTPQPVLLNLSIAHIISRKAIRINGLPKNSCQSDSTLLTPNREDVILEL